MQILALRVWQLSHGDQFPDSLNSLIPEELPILPDDPYSGRAFGYRRSQGEEMPTLATHLCPVAKKQEVPKPGSTLLYSIGQDRQDHGGLAILKGGLQSQPFDIVFTIPPVPAKTGAGGAKNQDPNIETD